MQDLDPFEPGTHTFTGVIRMWSAHSAELVTDSGLAIVFGTQGHQRIPEGTRITITAKKYRPRYLLVGIS
jgi:hypothetical protein